MSEQYIIVVGGIGGNELWLPSTFGPPPLRIWLDPVALLLSGWRLLGLGPDGVSQAVPGFSRLQGRLLLGAYYGTLSDYLAANGAIPVSYQQDWRLQLSQVVQGLIDLIHQLGAVTPVHIVSHSAGGLLLRQVLNVMPQADRTRLVGRCVGLGVPHQGSWEAVQLVGGCNSTIRLLTQVLMGSQAILLSPLLPGSIAQVSGSWPASYELFPMPGAVGDDPATIQRIYAGSTWSTVRPTANPTWLAAALARWSGALQVPPDVSWLDVVGTGTPTAVGLPLDGDPTEATDYLYSTAGDGAVPSAWATQPLRPRLLTSADHGAMVYDPAVMLGVVQWLQSAG